jgi:hypothetical protein
MIILIIEYIFIVNLLLLGDIDVDSIFCKLSEI